MKKSILTVGVFSLLLLIINGCGDCSDAVEAEKKACDAKITAVTDSLNTAWEAKLQMSVDSVIAVMKARAVPQAPNSGSGSTKTETSNSSTSTVTDRAGTKGQQTSTTTDRAGTKDAVKSTVTKRAGTKK